MSTSAISDCAAMHQEQDLLLLGEFQIPVKIASL
jgi:hypothetical protein